MSVHGSFNKLHRARNLAARFSPTLPTSLLTTSDSNPAGGKKTSVAPTSSTPPATTTPSTSSTPTSSQEATSSPTSATLISSVSSSSTISSSTFSTSSLSSSSTTTTSSSSTSSSLVLQTPLSTTSTPVVTVHSTYIATGVTLAPTSSVSATPPASTNSSGSINTTAVVGGIAGSLVGLAVLGFLVMWCIRRKRKSDEDEWSAAAFKRQSAILIDDVHEPQPSFNPRPPTMIERHNASPALTAQRNYPQNLHSGYGQQNAHGPGEVMYGGSPPQMQPYGYAPRQDPSQLARQPSNAAYLSRQPSAVGYEIPNDPYAHYVDLDRSSVTPFQAAQYADISRQLGSDPGPAVAPRKSMDAARLPSPFDEEEAVADAPPRTPSPAHISSSPAADSTTTSAVGSAPVPRGREITNAKRPDTVYTMYDEGDAYDGF